MNNPHESANRPGVGNALSALNALRGLAYEYGPLLRPWRWHMGLFGLLLVLFFGLHVLALSLPSMLHAVLNRNPALQMSYSAARVAWLPPRLTLANVRLEGSALRGEQLSFADLTVVPDLGQLLLARAGATFAFTAHNSASVQENPGTGQLFLRTGTWFDTDTLIFETDAKNLPLGFTSFATRFDPRMQAFFTGNATGTLLLTHDAGGRLVLRDCTATGKGLVRVVSARNGVPALKARRLTNAMLTLGGTLERRTLTLQDTHFSGPDVQAAITGKIVFDWRVLENAEVNIVANITANPDAIRDELLNDTIKILLGKNLPFAVQGNVRSLRISPLL